MSSSRLYSSSSLSLFDSSAPPPSRPVLSSNRLYIESKPTEVEGSQNSQNHSYSQPPFSLALAQPHSSSGQSLANSNPQGQYALFPYSSLTYPAYGQQHTQQTIQDKDAPPRSKRQRLKYQLDVGAYGIPKRCRSSRRHHSPDVCLSVQVGEDAYFVRDNAMGVADGVGGWSKSHLTQASSTPSALFARRLMHYCSAEVESCSKHSEKSAVTESYASALRRGSGSPHPPTRPQFSFTHQLSPRPSPSAPATPACKSSLSSSLPTSLTFHSVFNHAASSPSSQNNRDNHFTFSYSPPSKEYSTTERGDGRFGTEQDLEDSLEELSEGIDVLQILERAYDKTLKAHVVSGCEPFNSQAPSAPLLRADAVASAASLSGSSSVNSDPQGSRGQKSLLEGSSTALLAVLDHPPRTSHVLPITTPVPTSATSSASPTNSSSSTTSQTKKSPSNPFSIPTASACSTLNALSSPLQETGTAQTPLKSSTATAPLASRSASIESCTSSSGAGTAVSDDSAPEIECEVVEQLSRQGDYDAVMKIAHVGDCMGMLVRGEEIVWRSEEMWWSVSSDTFADSSSFELIISLQFNTPVQLGPSTRSTVTPRNSAMVITIPVKADDILILASDGLSDNLWDEDVLDEVVRFRKSFLDSAPVGGSDTSRSNISTDSGYLSSEDNAPSSHSSSDSKFTTTTMLKRKTLAGMLSEALCSRAKRVSEHKAFYRSPAVTSSELEDLGTEVDEVPFARRAREVGKRFIGGKKDDISVVVAVISPKIK